jgi:hypothetical protein
MLLSNNVTTACSALVESWSDRVLSAVTLAELFRGPARRWVHSAPVGWLRRAALDLAACTPGLPPER